MGPQHDEDVLPGGLAWGEGELWRERGVRVGGTCFPHCPLTACRLGLTCSLPALPLPPACTEWTVPLVPQGGEGYKCDGAGTHAQQDLHGGCSLRAMQVPISLVVKARPLGPACLAPLHPSVTSFLHPALLGARQLL